MMPGLVFWSDMSAVSCVWPNSSWRILKRLSERNWERQEMRASEWNFLRSSAAASLWAFCELILMSLRNTHWFHCLMDYLHEIFISTYPTWVICRFTKEKSMQIIQKHCGTINIIVKSNTFWRGERALNAFADFCLLMCPLLHDTWCVPHTAVSILCFCSLGQGFSFQYGAFILVFVFNRILPLPRKTSELSAAPVNVLSIKLTFSQQRRVFKTAEERERS